MQEFVARENIKRFEAQLDASTDQKQREVLIELLEGEQPKIDTIKSPPRQPSNG